MQHLSETFGPTKQMRCSTFLDGIKREGRRPTDHLALIRDRGKDVTIDDLEKQLVLRGLPKDVQMLLQDKLEGKNALESAQLADQHFDQQGSPLNSDASICSVDNAQGLPTDAFQSPPQQPDQGPEVNAVNSHQGRPTTQSSNNRYTPAFASNNSNQQSRSNSRPRQRPNRSSSNRSTSNRSTSNHAPTPPASGGNNEMSPCRLHRDDPSSSNCVGPNCPRHYTATSCWSRSCPSHAGQGNGRGGRH